MGLGHRPPAIVYFHGGGWVAGDLRSHDGVVPAAGAVSGCLVVAVDYRLAPEHPYPAAVDDAWPPTGGSSGTPTSWGSTPGGSG